MCSYQVIKQLGQGGFAIVSLIQFSDGTYAARKEFHPNQGQVLSQQEIEHIKDRFKREVITLTEIDHPNVVKVLRSEIHLDPPAYIMPVADSTLGDDLAFVKAQPLSSRIKILMDIFAGLEAIHDLSIYHRDLKPQNILKFGNDYAISDFGLISLDKSQVSVLTQTGMYMGSDRYTAPEITSELKFSSRASDIYSVGCILHDLTTTGSGARVPCNQIKDPTNPYEGILQICTRSEKNDRFQSVKDLREAVISIVMNESEQPVVGSNQEKILSILKSQNVYDLTFVNDFINLLETNSLSDSQNILINLDSEILEKLVKINDTNMVSRLCGIYAKWIYSYSFDFAMCDVLASRLDSFWIINDPEVRSNVLLGLLIMGASHNRWYVEQKFVSRIKNCDDNTARRFVLESAVRRREVISAINHLPKSINFNRSELPPLIQQGFAKHGI